MLIGAKNPGTLGIVGSVVHPTCNLYARYLHGTQSALDTDIGLFAYLISQPEEGSCEPKRRDFGLYIICI